MTVACIGVPCKQYILVLPTKVEALFFQGLSIIATIHLTYE